MSASSIFTVNDHRRRAAIALNNVAVTLLTRGHVREATETLADAIKVMRSAMIDAKVTAGHPNDAFYCDFVQQALSQSNQRVCCVGSLNNAGTIAAMPMLHELSSQDNPDRVLDLLISHTCPSAQVAFPLTIDPIDFGNQPSNDEVDFEAAAIMYNLGIAIECLANTMCHPTCLTLESLELYEKSFKCFKMSGALLGKVDEGKPFNNRMCPCLARRAMLLRIVLLHSLIDASIQLNLDDEYEVYSRDIQHMLHTVEVINILIPAVDHHIAAAA